MSEVRGTNQYRKLFAGMRIRRLRRDLGLTQAVMADSLGISTSYLNLIERDQRPVSAQILIKMVDVFDSRYLELLDGQKKISSPENVAKLIIDEII